MIKVKFYNEVNDSLLKYAVIISRYHHQWVFCKHKKRNTYECPGGHREANETISECAKRELWEETGAIKYDMYPICIYSVIQNHTETFGKLYFANIYEFENLPDLEIEKIAFFTNLPKEWTYPNIQPKLLKKVIQVINE